MTDIISDLQPYILNESNIQNYLKYKIKINQKEHSNLEIQKNNIIKSNHIKSNHIKSNHIKSNSDNSIFIPREQDTLFWCYYIIKNGDIKYETLNNRNTLTTRQLKIDYVSKIREKKQIVKTYKFDTISNIESNLANDNNITIKSFMTLCAIENINIIFVSRKTYFEFLMNDTSNIFIIREIESQSNYAKKYGFEIANSEMLNQIRNTLYRIETIDKPIKALSSYKVQDLIDIANKLAIKTINEDTGKQMTKNLLYESIIKYF